jgi:hypothetical protein
MTDMPSYVVNVDEVKEDDYTSGECWGGIFELAKKSR